MELYSKLKPETNSDSASGKSKGGLFVSAKIVIKNITNNGEITKNNGAAVWKVTMDIKFNEPTNTSVAIKIKPIHTSYEIICAALLRAPKKAYLELLLQPEKIMP